MINESYKTRLLIEYKQLIERRAILENTLNSESCTSIDSKQIELMRKQYEGMMVYEDCLYSRIIDLMN